MVIYIKKNPVYFIPLLFFQGKKKKKKGMC